MTNSKTTTAPSPSPRCLGYACNKPLTTGERGYCKRCDRKPPRFAIAHEDNRKLREQTAFWAAKETAASEHTARVLSGAFAVACIVCESTPCGCIA